MLNNARNTHAWSTAARAASHSFSARVPLSTSPAASRPAFSLTAVPPPGHEHLAPPSSAHVSAFVSTHSQDRHRPANLVSFDSDKSSCPPPRAGGVRGGGQQPTHDVTLAAQEVAFRKVCCHGMWLVVLPITLTAGLVDRRTGRPCSDLSTVGTLRAVHPCNQPALERRPHASSS